MQVAVDHSVGLGSIWTIPDDGCLTVSETDTFAGIVEIILLDVQLEEHHASCEMHTALGLFFL